MCLATPSKITKIDGDWAIVDTLGHSHTGEAGKYTHRANLSLVKGAKVGDYVIVHADLALNKIEKDDAKKILKMIKKLDK